MRNIKASFTLSLLLLLTLIIVAINLIGVSSNLAPSSPISSNFPAFLLEYYNSYTQNAPLTPTYEPIKDKISSFDYGLINHRPKYALASSVQTSRYADFAMTLGYSILKHNDIDALDMEMVLLVRIDGADGVTAQNISNLERVGWKVQVAEELEFDDVDIDAIRSWHRHNLNKLHLWTWTQYEKVIFVDADIVCKGPIGDILEMPGDIAASPDVWWNKLVDNRFNSGVLVMRPNLDEFRALSRAVSDPNMHDPWEADQAFLNTYYKFRYYGLPFKYNLNLVMVEYHRKAWKDLWDEAMFVHLTVQKPKPGEWCLKEKGCPHWEVLDYYRQVNREMQSFYGFKDLAVIG